MKIRVISDLHLEHRPDDCRDISRLVPELPDDCYTVLVIAGDLGVCSRADTFAPALNDLVGRFRKVIYIMGNHEHYYSHIDETVDRIKANFVAHFGVDESAINFVVGDNFVEVIDDVHFICSTLWSDFEDGDPDIIRYCQSVLNDYRYIYENGGFLQPSTILKKYEESRTFILKSISEAEAAGCKSVVVTHHGPSQRSVHEQYMGSKLNGGFVSDSLYLNSEIMPDVHIHGHVHNRCNYSLFNKTRVLANPAGYPGEPLSEYDPVFVFDSDKLDVFDEADKKIAERKEKERLEKKERDRIANQRYKENREKKAEEEAKEAKKKKAEERKLAKKTIEWDDLLDDFE